MQFRVVQQLPCTPDAVFDLLEEDVLEERVRTSSSSLREPLEKVWRDRVLLRRTRIRPVRELPALVNKLLGPEGLSYIQTVHTDREAQLVRWSLDVDRVGDRVRIGGTETLAATGTGCVLTVDAEVVVRVPVVAGRVEKAVEKEIRRVYGRRETYMLDLLAGR